MSNAPSSVAKAGRGENTPSLTAREVPTSTGATAAGRVLGRIAINHAFQEENSGVWEILISGNYGR
jgi:hypothetical protein